MPSTYANESITVSSTAVGFTSSTYTALQPYVNLETIVTVESQPIRVCWDGTSPSSTVGHPRSAGDIITLDDIQDIENFKAIRTTTTDATLWVTHKNKQY